MKKDKSKSADYVEYKNRKESVASPKSEDDKLLQSRWKKFIGGSQEQKKKNSLPPPPKPPRPPEKGASGEETKVSPEPKEKKTENSGGESADNGEVDIKKADVREVLETTVDKLYELAKKKGVLKVKDASKALGMDSEQVEEWARILEEHRLVRLHYPPVGDPVLILKRYTSDTEKIKSLKEKKKLRPKKRVFIINLAIMVIFAVLLSFYTIRFQSIRITYTQAYLTAAVIIIIGIFFVLMFIRKRRKNAKRSEEKTVKQAG